MRQVYLHLNQKKYILDLLNIFKMDNASSCPIPMVTEKQFTTTNGEPMMDPTLFLRAIGALQYVVNTRSNIGLSVNKLSQYMQSPTTIHWQGVKIILRYLNGTLDLGLHLKP